MSYYNIPSEQFPKIHNLNGSPDALWQFSISGSSIDISDSSGNSEDLAVDSGAIYPVVTNNGDLAAVFGGGDSLDLSTDNGNLGYTGSMTLMCWLRPLDTGTGCIACYDSSGTAESDSAPWMFFFNSAGNGGTLVLQFQFWNGSSLTTRTLTSNVGLLHNEWNHIVIYRYLDSGNTYTNGYINGKKLFASDTLAGGTPERGTNSKLVIGALQGGSTSMVAALQSLVLYGRQLSAAEIEAEIKRVVPNNLLASN